MGGNQSRSERNEGRSQSDATPGLSDDRLYRALASTRRRRLLYLLLDEEESTVDQIATVLTGWNATESGGMATPDDHEQIFLELLHTHLPVLDKIGMVAHDRESGTVRIGALDTAVVDLICQSVEVEPPSRS